MKYGAQRQSISNNLGLHFGEPDRNVKATMTLKTHGVIGIQSLIEVCLYDIYAHTGLSIWYGAVGKGLGAGTKYFAIYYIIPKRECLMHNFKRIHIFAICTKRADPVFEKVQATRK